MGVLKIKTAPGVWTPVAQGVGIASPGLVASAIVTAPQTIGPTSVDLTGLSVTFNADPTHTYLYEWQIPISKDATPASVWLNLKAGTNIVETSFLSSYAANERKPIVGWAIESGIAAGAATRKLTLNCNAGNATSNASATERALLVVTDITAATIGGLATAWTAVTFLNGWANKGGTETPCQYRKIGDIVYLRGVMTKTGVTYGQAAFQLPAAYASPYTIRPNPLAMNVAGTQSLARADVVAGNGVYAPQAGPSPDVGWWSIDMAFSVTT